MSETAHGFESHPLRHTWLNDECCLAFFFFRVRICALREAQTAQHGVRGIQLGGGVQVRVDVRRRAEIAVAQPLLSLLGRDVMRQQERGTTVAQIVEPNAAQAVPLQHKLEVSGKVFRADAVTHFVDADVPLVVPAVAISAQSAIRGLFGLQLQQKAADGRRKRQRPAAGFRFGGVPGDDGVLAIHVTAGHGVLNCDRAVFKVDGVPLEAQHLAPAKPIERGQLHRRFDDQPLHAVKQPIDFVLIIEAGQEAVLLGTVDLVRWVRWEQVGLDRVLERPVDDDMIVNDGVGADTLELRRVEVLNVLGGQLLQRYASLLEPGTYGVAKHPEVGTVGCDGNRALGNLEPSPKVLVKGLVAFIRAVGGFRGLEGSALFHQERLGLLFVSLHGETGGNPLGFPLVAAVLVAEDGVKCTILFLQVSCDHVLSSFSFAETIHLPLAEIMIAGFRGDGKRESK